MFFDDELEQPIEEITPPKKRGRKKKEQILKETSDFEKLKKFNQAGRHKEKKKVSKHYINDAEFKAILERFHELRKQNPKCKMPDELGSAFMIMATNIIRLPYFNQRPDKEDLIMDAITTCIDKVGSFDMTRNSPFAYFTSVIRNSFWLSRKVNNHRYYGDKNCYKDGVLDTFAIGDHETDDFDNIYQEALYYE